jgi:hypothetical protein
LTDGDKFAQGALGYETDAADVEEINGVPRATGRDGTPPSFTVLATADLRHWSAHGQGGAATMGVFDSGAGTVFNAGTVNWGAALPDPVVARITRNVLDRLSGPRVDRWTVIGTRDGVRALAGSGALLWAVLADGALAVREACGQNLRWQRVEPAPGVIAVPREAVPGGPHEMYAATTAGALLRRPLTTDRTGWTPCGTCPADTVSLAACDCRLFALASDVVWVRDQGGAEWTTFAGGAALRSIAAANGRLFAVSTDDVVVSRPATADADWTVLRDADGIEVLAAHAGRLIGAGGGRPLRWSAVAPLPPRPHHGGHVDGFQATLPQPVVQVGDDVAHR